MKSDNFKLNHKIGKIKKLHDIEDGIYLGSWGGWSIIVWTNNGTKTFETNIGLKQIDAPVFVKAKEGILTIWKIAKQ
jgi:hypothetical protein